jgi:hypothetical protein
VFLDSMNNFSHAQFMQYLFPYSNFFLASSFNLNFASKELHFSTYGSLF